MNTQEFKDYFLGNIVEIREEYKKTIQRRLDKENLSKIIEQVRTEVLLEDDYRVMSGYEFLIESQYIKSTCYILLIDPQDKEKFNIAYFNKINKFELFFKYFDIDVNTDIELIASLEANNGSHYTQDKKLIDLVSYVDRDSYDLESVDKEIGLIGKLVDYYKKY